MDEALPWLVLGNWKLDVTAGVCTTHFLLGEVGEIIPSQVKITTDQLDTLNSNLFWSFYCRNLCVSVILSRARWTAVG